MPDAKGRLGELDRITAPDLWPAIQGREPRGQEPEQRYGRRVLAAAVALLVTAAGMAFVVRALLTSKPSLMVPAITPRSNGQIVFGCGELPFNSDLCVMENDHSPATRLVTDVGQALNPDWSPDGSRIALQVGGGADSGDASIFLMNADGSGLHEVIPGNDGNFDLDPDWSPDGTRIAFTRTPPGGIRGIDDDLFVADVDGLGVRKVFDSQTEAFDPRWSPDGTRLAFTQWDVPEGGRFDVFLLDLRDGRVARVTRSGSASQAEWAPDGASLAFVQGGRIKQIRPDGTGERTLYECRCAGISGLAWAPDGSAILFGATVYRGDQPAVQLFEMNADGTGVQQITFGSDSVCCPAWQPVPRPPVPTDALPTPESSPTVTDPSTPDQVAYEHDGGIWVTSDGEGRRLAAGAEPSWSPDGALIAFRRESGSLQEVWVMSADGVDLRRVAQVKGNYEYGGPPAWSPDGRTLAFASEEGIWFGAVQGEEASLVLEPSEVVHGTGACYLEHPDWSTAGEIVFAVDCEGGGEGIFVMGSDGSGARIIAEAAPLQRYVQPSWSPDGKRIVFTIGDESGFWSIAVMQDDGSGLVQLQPDEGYVETYPSWSPEGLRIVFARSKPIGGSGFDLYSMNADGGDRTLVTSDPGDETAPDWGQ